MIFLALLVTVLAAIVVATGTAAARAERVGGWAEAAVWTAYAAAVVTVALAALTWDDRSLLPAGLVLAAAALLSFDRPAAGGVVAAVVVVLPQQVSVGLFRYPGFAVAVLAGAVALRASDVPDEPDEPDDDDDLGDGAGDGAAAERLRAAPADPA